MKNNSKNVAATPLRMKSIAAAVLALTCISHAGVTMAAELGSIKVLSQAEQPLIAEIEILHEDSESISDMRAELASASRYDDQGITYHPSVEQVHLEVRHQGPRSVIKLTTKEPLPLPSVQVLVSLSTGEQVLNRPYTLHGQAKVEESQNESVVTAEVKSDHGVQITPMEEVTPPIATTAAPEPKEAQEAPKEVKDEPKTELIAPQKTEVKETRTHKVRPGDTLAKIAHEMKPREVDLSQMLFALQSTNPDAFAGGNMNRLVVGKVLRAPTTDEIQGVDLSKAKSEVTQQFKSFKTYKAKLAGIVAEAAPTPAAPAKQSVSGKVESAKPINPRVEPVIDKLKLSAASAKPKKDSPGAEDKIAKDKAAAEASKRLKELEANVSDLQKLLEAKNGLLSTQKSVNEAMTVKNAELAAEVEKQKKEQARLAAEKKKAEESAKYCLGDVVHHPYTTPIAATLGGLLAGLAGLAVIRKRKSSTASSETSTQSPTDTKTSRLAALLTRIRTLLSRRKDKSQNETAKKVEEPKLTPSSAPTETKQATSPEDQPKEKSALFERALQAVDPIQPEQAAGTHEEQKELASIEATASAEEAKTITFETTVLDLDLSSVDNDPQEVKAEETPAEVAESAPAQEVTTDEVTQEHPPELMDIDVSDTPAPNAEKESPSHLTDSLDFDLSNLEGVNEEKSDKKDE